MHFRERIITSSCLLFNWTPLPLSVSGVLLLMLLPVLLVLLPMLLRFLSMLLPMLLMLLPMLCMLLPVVIGLLHGNRLSRVARLLHGGLLLNSLWAS